MENGDHVGFDNYVNYQNHTSNLYKPVPPPLTAIDRFLWGRARVDHHDQTQNDNDEPFVSSNGVPGFSFLGSSSGMINNNVSQICVAPSAKSFIVDDDYGDVFSNDIGECITLEELEKYQNRDRKHDFNQVIIQPEKMRGFGNKSKGGATTTSKVLIKGQWTYEEDRELIRLVNKYGDRKWALIAEKMIGRAGKQCRERWRNHLRPDIKKDTWSEEEVKMLIEAHQKVGNKWAEIAKIIPGRTENSIKNQWNATKRKQNSRRKNKKKDDGHVKNKKSSQSTLLADYIKSKTNGHNNLLALSPASSSSTILYDPEFATSNDNDSDPSLEITQSYDDELNFMQNFFQTTSNDTSSHVLEPTFDNSQCGFSSTFLGEINSNIYLNIYPEDNMSKAHVALDVSHLEEAIARPSSSDYGCHGDGSSSNAEKIGIW